MSGDLCGFYVIWFVVVVCVGFRDDLRIIVICALWPWADSFGFRVVAEGRSYCY